MTGCIKSKFAWCAVIFALALVGGNAESSPEKIYRKVLPAVMTLDVENHRGERFVGSGFLALGDDLVVTAWHVVSDARKVWATFADGQRLKVVGCVDKDGARDLALLKLEKPLPSRRVALCSELQEVASRAYVIGAPKGYGFSISDGLVSQVRQVDGFSQYQISCPISPGNSGGPVLNERGEVIGVASWTKSDAQNVSFAIPSREVARLKPSRKPVLWTQLTENDRPALAARWVEPTPVRKPEIADGTLLDLKKRLEAAAGKRITVVVQEEGEENKFTFTVPSKGLE
jgi:S1-C subfamily serine protease